MGVSDILNQAFSREGDSDLRQQNLPSIAPANAPPAPPPMPFAMPEQDQSGPNMAALAMGLLGQQGGNKNNGMQGGMQGGQGLSDFNPGGGGSAALARRIGGWVDSRPGFSVSGLEGYGGTGQVSTGHITNSQHYSGMAGDVGYNGGGKFGGAGNENAALDWLYNKLNKRWGDQLTELIWEAPDHWDHLHYGTRPGG